MQLQTVVPPDSQIYLKCERQNRTGSMKDRMADAMLGSAGSDGLLPSGGTVVVYTGLNNRSSVKIF